MFGFTETPIFAKNATNKSNPDFYTTEQAFGDKLHTYTIVEYIIEHFDQKTKKRKKDIVRRKKCLLKLKENKAKVIKNLLKAPTHTMPMQYNNELQWNLLVME